MNVTCEKCQRRYVVPDEKLQERSLRLRCRNCQSVIEVALPPAPPTATASPAANPWEEEPTRAAPRLDPNARWFAMVKGHQVGPLELSALGAKVASSEVTLATFLWREGMEGWRKAEELPELLPVFAAPKVSAPVQAPPSPKPSLHNLFDDDERTVLRPKKKQLMPEVRATPVTKRADPLAPELPDLPERAEDARASQAAPRVDHDRDDEDFEDDAPPRRRGWRWVAVAVALAAIGGVVAWVVRPG